MVDLVVFLATLYSSVNSPNIVLRYSGDKLCEWSYCCRPAPNGTLCLCCHCEWLGGRCSFVIFPAKIKEPKEDNNALEIGENNRKNLIQASFTELWIIIFKPFHTGYSLSFSELLSNISCQPRRCCKNVSGSLCISCFSLFFFFVCGVFVCENLNTVVLQGMTCFLTLF